MVRLADVSVVSGAAIRDNRKSDCGGIMSLTLLPIGVLLYGFVWFNDWYNGNRGALQETTITQLQFGTGYAMQGDQELYCMAASGCWYTRFTDRTARRLEPTPSPAGMRPGASLCSWQPRACACRVARATGQSCPPQAAIRTMSQKSQSLTQLFNTGNIGSTSLQLPTKECAYAARGEKLVGVCIYATPDPIDKVTVTWGVDSTQGDGQNFGVALKTEAVRPMNRTNYRRENEAAMDDSVEGLAARWFKWRTDGGGRGYEVRMTGTEIHYGDVELQVLRYRSAHQPRAHQPRAHGPRIRGPRMARGEPVAVGVSA